MKKVLLFTSLCLASCLISAQDLVTKIPSNASAVFTIKGKNITDLVSTQEFENSKVGKLFLKEMTKETDGKVTNLASLGINLSENMYYFLEMNEGMLTHNILVSLNNKEGFLNLMDESKKEELVTEGELTYLIDKYDTSLTMWNNDTFLFVFAQDLNKNNDYVYDDYGYTDYDVVEEATDAVAETAGEAVEAASTEYIAISFDEYDYYFGDVVAGEPLSHSFGFTNSGDGTLFIENVESTCGCTIANFPKEGIAPGETGTIELNFDTTGILGSQYRTITITTNTDYRTDTVSISAYVTKKAVKTSEENNTDEEIVAIVTEAPKPECDAYGYSYNYNNDFYTKQEEERNAKKEEKRQENLVVLLEKAKATMNANYANGTILTNKNYVKSLGNGTAEATLWVDDFGGIYNEMLSSMVGSSLYNPYEMFDFQRLYGGMSLTSRLNFEDTMATINTEYTMNDEMASYSRDMYNGKLNKNFFKYFNEDKAQAYFSLNMSTEGILNAYPKMMENMFEGIEKDHLNDLVPIITRLVSVMLDEEAIAKALRGDMLFVMTGLEQKDVEYTTYEYDENYESTEVTKTKTETLPSFLFMVTSEEQEIFNRLMRIGIKEKAIIFENGMYQLNLPNMPFTLNMLFKDNTLLIGNSTDDMIAINQGNYKAKVSGKHKKLMAKNASVIYINGKLMANQIPDTAVPSDLKEKMNFVRENVEDVVFRVGQVKGNSLDGEMILNTPTGKGHKNSLAYFMNMVDSLVD